MKRQKLRLIVAEVLFVVLMIGLAYLFGIQPARRESWAGIQNQWKALKQTIAERPSILVTPFDWTTVELHGLARFGDELEFLGCDIAITQDEEGSHVWQVTIWRALTPLKQDYTMYMHFVRPGDGGPLFSQSDHLLGQQFPEGAIPTSQWVPGATMLDAIMLPDGVRTEDGVQTRIGVWIPETDVHLAPDTDLLEVDEYGRLVICQ